MFLVAWIALIIKEIFKLVQGLCITDFTDLYFLKYVYWIFLMVFIL
jgi:hypothetical protein